METKDKLFCEEKKFLDEMEYKKYREAILNETDLLGYGIYDADNIEPIKRFVLLVDILNKPQR